MSEQRFDADVLIVGYGPVGSTAANFLGQEGLSVIAIDRDVEVYSRARAISTDEDVIRHWQMVGLAEKLKADMLGDRPIDFVDRNGRSFLEFKLTPRGLGHPSQMFIYQPALEATIREGVERFPNVDVRLGHEAGAVRQGAGSVEVDVTDLSTGATRTIRAKWLLACDGGSSPVRTQLGIGFEGKTYEDPWVVIDTKVKKEWPEVNHLRFHCDPERPAVDCPTPLGHHRWEFPVFPGEDRERVSSESQIWKMLARYGITDEHVEILRRAVYVHHVRTAERWRDRRLFLLGDAAHCMPPWIGQGMGSGVRDAGNLCWKLAAVTRGEATDALLDSYEAERKPHVRKVTQAAVFFGRVITERRRVLIPLRNVAFSVAMRTPVIGPYLRSGDWFPEPDYKRGFADRASREQHRTVGAICRQSRIVRKGESESVLMDEILGTGWSIVSRTEREAGAWDGLARVHVIGRDFDAQDEYLARSLGDADALILRPDRVIYAAASAGEQLPPPPVELHGSGPAAVAPQQTTGERALRAAADRLGDRGLELTFGQAPALVALFGEMTNGFVARVANGFEGDIQYDLRRGNGRISSWTIEVGNDGAKARRGRAKEPALVVGMALPDFLRVAAGQLDQLDLLKARRVSLSGDGLLGARLGPMFGLPAPPEQYVTPRTVDPPVKSAPEAQEAIK